MNGKTEPRLFTKPLRELTEETSLGFACIEYAKTVLKKTLYPWQEWALIHALEITGTLGAGWRFRFRTILFLISRQNGKTVLSEVLASFFMNVLMVENIFGTSLSLEKAEEVWEAVIRDQEEFPELSAEITRISRSTATGRHGLQLRRARTQSRTGWLSVSAMPATRTVSFSVSCVPRRSASRRTSAEMSTRTRSGCLSGPRRRALRRTIWRPSPKPTQQWDTVF